MDRTDNSCLARQAFVEQSKMNLSWYESHSLLLQQLNANTKGFYEDMKSSEVKLKLQTKFNDMWNTAAKSSTKLNFYSSVKDGIKFEPYLNLKNRSIRKVLTRFRSSSHRLSVKRAATLTKRTRTYQ